MGMAEYIHPRFLVEIFCFANSVACQTQSFSDTLIYSAIVMAIVFPFILKWRDMHAQFPLSLMV